MPSHQPWLAAVTFVLALSAGVFAEEAPAAAKLPADVEKSIKSSIDRGLAYLRAAWDANRPKDAKPGHLTHWGHPGITALALTAFYKSPRNYRNADGPFVREPFEYLLSIQREDGAINDSDGLDNYITSVAMLALVASKENVKTQLDKAAAFLAGSQLDEGEGYRPADKNYGGQGYGSSQRPDLSNTQLAIEAMAEYGLPKDHEFFKRAMVFVQRCQNSSETNDLESFNGEDGETYVPGNDGGFYYHPGRSEALEPAVKGADGVQSLRSYGSMTYAGFKSMLHAGLTRDDPRVRAALAWIQANYRLDENPGAGLQGLYYYFHTFARTMAANGTPTLRDAEGVEHDWRVDLGTALVARQAADGSWANENGRWMESNPVLATCYALLALETCLGR